MKITREDFAIGFDLIVSSLILLVTYSSKLALELSNNKSQNVAFCKTKLEYLPWILFFAILGLWSLSTIVRINGWKDNNSKTPKIWTGVIVPTALGILSLLLTVNFIE